MISDFICWKNLCLGVFEKWLISELKIAVFLNLTIHSQSTVCNNVAGRIEVLNLIWNQDLVFLVPAGDYHACTCSTRRVWISGWPPAGNAPSAEWTLKPNWPLTVDSSRRLLQLRIFLVNSPLPPSGGSSAKHPSSPLRRSTSLPLFRRAWQRDQQSTLTYNTIRDGRWYIDKWLDWRLVEWTCWT